MAGPWLEQLRGHTVRLTWLIWTPLQKSYPDILYVDSLLEVQVQSSQGQSPYYLHDMTLGYVCSSLELVTSCFMNMVS